MMPSLGRLRFYRRFAFYCAIGAGSATLDFLIYLLFLTQMNLHYEIANAIGYAGGTVSSFLLNAHFNFRTTNRLTARFLAFCGVAFLGWALSAVILYVTINDLDWDKYFAKLVTIGVVVLVQYNLNRLISFRRGLA